MKMLIRRLVLIVLLLTLTGAPVVGVSARAVAVHLVFWHAEEGAQNTALQSLLTSFQQTHPSITIETHSYANGTLQGNFTNAGVDQHPDMILAGNDVVGQWSSADLVFDLNASIPDQLKGQISDAAWKLFRLKNSLYAIPYSAQTQAFFYNKKFVSTVPSTWADVLSTAQQIHSAHANVIGLAFPNSFFQTGGFFFSLGGQLMDADGNPAFGDDADGAAAMDTYLQFQQEMSKLNQDARSGVIMDGSSPNPGFESGTVAMTYDSYWNLAAYEKALGDNLGVSIMPMLDNGSVPALFAQGKGFYLKAGADDPTEEAFIEWCNFVTSVAGQNIAMKQGGLLPVNPAVKLDDPNLKIFADQFALGTPLPNQAQAWQYWGVMDNAITAATVGGESPDQARHEAYLALQKSLEVNTLQGVKPEPEATTSP